MAVACVTGLVLPAVIFCALCSSTLGNVLMNSFLQRRRHQTKPRGEYLRLGRRGTLGLGVNPRPPAPAGWSRPTSEPAPGTRPTGSPPRRERSDIVPIEYDRYGPGRPTNQ